MPADMVNAQPAREPTPSNVRSPRWWWNNFTKAILTLGALASAVAAIISLWPDPPAEREGQVEVLGLVPMPITVYQRRVPAIRGFVGLPQEPLPLATDGTDSGAPSDAAPTDQSPPPGDTPPPSEPPTPGDTPPPSEPPTPGDTPPPSEQSSSVKPKPSANPKSVEARGKV